MTTGTQRAEFPGAIGRTIADSIPAWAPAHAERRGASNVIMIVLDDVGFGQLGCYGSSISTPNIDALAADGIRYSNFHVAALCSPTRASLLTGRNHHSVGVGFLADFDSGFPGYRGAVDPEVPMLPEILRDNGYSTYAVGKWHLTPPSQMTPAGPFGQWPTRRGFDRYYGFLGGEDDQWAPELWEDTHYAERPSADAGYHLSEDLIDRSMRYLSDHVSSVPERPFFLYLALGAGHAPHQAPREYLDRYTGRFDHGWDVERERILSRQIELGIVPEGTRLPPPNAGVAAWDELDADQRRLYARMQEVFAGFLEHADAQIGRLVDFLRDYGLLDDTMIVVMSDNGASGEGGAHGSANEYRYFLGLDDPFEDSLAKIDELGGPSTHNHYPSGWAQAGNTPLKMYKKFTYGGGVRAPFIINWAGHLRQCERVRSQFHHVSDVTPTILSALGIASERETSTDGSAHLGGFHGAAFDYTFTDADALGRKRRQYFETAGYRGIYLDGFKAIAVHTPGDDYDEDPWELYHLGSDFSETKNLADELPERLERMIAAWWQDAEEFQVLPLDDRMQTRVETRDVGRERSRYRMLPGTRMPNGSAAPGFNDREFTATVTLRGFRGDESGVLMSYGRRAAGFVLYMEDGEAVFHFNRAGDHTVIRSEAAAPAGTERVVLRLIRRPGGGRAVIEYDGHVAAEGALPSLFPAGLGCLSLQIGYNAPSPVSDAYVVPARFSGTIFDVVIEFDDKKLANESVALSALLASE